MSDRVKIKDITKSLTEIIDAGMSHATCDAERLFLLTSLALHIEKRQKDIGNDTASEEGTENSSKCKVKRSVKLKKKEEKREA